MKKKFILLAMVGLGYFVASAQENPWTQVTESQVGRNIFQDRDRPASFKLFQLKESHLQTHLRDAPSEKNISLAASSLVIPIPDASGLLQEFRVLKAPVMDVSLAARYPGIESFIGQSVQDPSRVIRFAYSPLGFYGMVYSPGKPTVYIERIDKSTGTYICVSGEFIPRLPFSCSTTDPESGLKALESEMPVPLANADDGSLRTYRLAMAATGEYSQSWLDGTEANDGERRAKVLAAMNNHMTRVNGIMERDFGLRMLLIGNNDLIIYLDPATDPWTAEFNAKTQETIDNVIGDANYDIGHLVKMGGDNGNAGSVGNVCIGGAKGSAYTSRSDWTSGIYFEEYILTHEMGHQYDANHTFTHADDNDNAQMEPGSGNTIMSYAGITGANTDIQSLMDDYFHGISIQQATDWIKSHDCHVTAISGLNPPTANAGSDYTIPKSTPFILTGNGSDPDEGDILTFNWEQMDKITAPGDFPWLPNPNHTYGPEFKSVLPSSSTSRTFPAMVNILDGSNTNKWEKLPSVSRSLNFRFTVRDNHPGSGQNKSDNMVVTVDGTKGPFLVTAPNTAVTWCPGTHTVTWSLNGTDALAANVKISLSYDAGTTFPTVLAASTPNDGSADVVIPCTYGKAARIKVEAIGNIFFDISNADFTVGDNTKPTFTVPANITINKDANCNYNAGTGITGDVTDESDNCDNTLNATYVDGTAPGSCDGETILTRTWTLTDDCGNSTVKVQTITITDVTPPTFTDPADITIYKDANCNHDASVGVTGDVTDEDDNCDNTLDATYSDVSVPGSCIGEEIITRTWTLSDDCGNSLSKSQIITVRDNTKPVISNISPDPSILWPPNHKMRDVTIGYTAVDNCSPVTNVLTVASNEPVNGTGDGDTAPDWEVIDDHHVRLRAERAGSGNGRIYTITITSTDDCGNVAVATTQVMVPHAMTTAAISILPDETTGQELSVRALPNPSSGAFSITILSENRDDRVLLSVFDMYGRRIEDKWVNSGMTVGMGDQYRPGTYLLRVIQGKLRKELKLVKL
ncbi:MAG: reprolysin-like metallopeptidase [Chitinophagaceae bacterium]